MNIDPVNSQNANTILMKRFEVEFEKDIYWIVLFDRSKRKHMFSYEGEVHVSPLRTAETKHLPLFFSFQLSRTEYGWKEIGELELKNEPEEAKNMPERIRELLIEGIKEFEGVE
jgi:hypothetical protein